MKNIILSLCAFLLASAPACAQSIKISALPSGSAPTGSELVLADQGGATVTLTAAELKTYVLTGQATVATSGAYSDLSGKPTLGTLSGITVGGTASSGYVVQSNGDGTYSWVASGAGGITLGSNATGILTFSSSVLNLLNPVNTANGLVKLDGGGQLVTGLLGNYIGVSGGLQGYSGGTLSIGTGKTLTASNTLTLVGTDGSTLNVGAGGTLGTAAYTAQQVIGSDVEAWSANLDAWGATTTSADVLAAAENALDSSGGLASYDGLSEYTVTGLYNNDGTLSLIGGQGSVGIAVNVGNLVGEADDLSAGYAYRTPVGSFDLFFEDTPFSTSYLISGTGGLEIASGATSLDGGAITTDGAGDLTADTYAGDGAALTGLTWAQIGSAPTTVAGYGITDAVSLSGTNTWTGPQTFTDNGYRAVQATDQDVYSTTYINSSSLTVTLPAGTYRVKALIELTTVSTTSGLTLQLYTQSGDTSYGSMWWSPSITAPPVNTRTFNNSSAGANYLLYGNVNAPSLDLCFNGDGELTVATSGSVYTVQFAQYSATDATNPVVLKAGSRIFFERIR